MKKNPTSRLPCVRMPRMWFRIDSTMFCDPMTPSSPFSPLALWQETASVRVASAFVRSYQEYKSSLPEIFRLNLRQLQLSARKANN